MNQLKVQKTIEGSYLKLIFFELLFLLIKDENIPIYVTGIFTLLQYCQILYFAFHPIIGNLWNSPIQPVLQQVFGTISLAHLFYSSSWTTFIAIFYVCVTIVVSFLIAISYAMYCIYYQKVVSKILITYLRYIVNIVLTFLYIPLLNTFVLVLKCNEVETVRKGKSVLQQWEVECWQNTYFLHVISGIIIVFILVFTSLLFGALYFDGIHDQKKPTSKINNFYCVSLILYKTLLVITYNFLDDSDSGIISICAFFVGGLLTFYTIHILRPFNNLDVRTYYSVLTSINMWTAIYMVIALIVENRIFSGVIYCWILTVPIIVIIILWSPYSKEKKKENQYLNVNKFLTAEEVMEHCQYVIGLIILDEDKKQKGNLLNGYIEFHNKTCLQTSCPLKKVKFMSSNLRKNKGLVDITIKKSSIFPMKESKNKDLRYTAVYDMILKLFEQGIAKFPLSIPLRIYFIVFLTSIFRSWQHAFAEIIEIQKFKCSFDQTFLLFYLKRNIEHEVFLISQETQGENIQDKLQIESSFSHFKSQIEQVVLLLLEFWSELGEEKPDVSKLLDIGTRILPLKLQVDVSWRKLSRVSGESFSKILRIYSKYLIVIFGDYQRGNELALKAKRLESAHNDKKNPAQKIVQNIMMDGLEDGMIIMTLEDEKIGVMTQVNQSLVNIFGYHSKSELNFKNVSNLMPSIIAPIHDEILSKYKLVGEQHQIGRERSLLAKYQNHLLIPILLTVKPVYNQLKDTLEIFAVVKKERSLKHIAYIVCNNKGIVTDYSATALSILGLQCHCSTYQEINIDCMVPDYLTNIGNYEQKMGLMIKYMPPQFEKGLLNFAKERRKSQEIDLNVVIQTYKVNALDFKAGYIFKFELIHKRSDQIIKRQLIKKDSSSLSDLTSVGKKLASDLTSEGKNLFFQFKLSIHEDYLRYYGGWYESAYNNVLDISYQIMAIRTVGETDYANLLMSTNSNVIMIQNERQQINEEIHEDLKIKKKFVERNWGEGYKIVRWQNGNYFEVEKDDSEEGEDGSSAEQGSNAEQLNNVQHKQQQQQTPAGDKVQKAAGFHGAKDLNEILQKGKESNTVSVLRQYSIFVLLVMLSIGIIDYAIKVSQIGNLKQDIQQIILSSRQISEIQLIVSNTRELTLTNRKIRVYQYSLTQGYPPNALDDEKQLRTIIQNAIQRLEAITIEILKNQRLKSGEVNVFFNYEKFEIYDFGYATQQMLAKAHGILALPLEEILQDQSEVFFIMHNGLNDYCKMLFDRYNEVVVLNFDNLVVVKDGSLNILIASIIIMIFFAIVLTFLLARTIITKQIILSSFLDLSEKTTKMLYQRCENFLLEINFEEGDLISEMDLDVVQDRTAAKIPETDKDQTSIFGKKRKRFKISDTKKYSFSIKMLMISIFIESFFVINNIFGNNQVFIMNELLSEFNVTNIAEPFYSMTLNAEYQNILDIKWTVFNEPPMEFIPVLIDNLYNIDGTLLKEHAKNTRYHENAADYISAFDHVYFQDACQVVVESKDAGIVQCNTFGSGIVTKGMVSVVIRYFQLLRYNRDRLAWISDNPNIPFVFDSTYEVVNLSPIVFLNNMYNVVRLPDTYEQIEIQTRYLKSAFRYLQDNFLEEMIFIFDSYLINRILILILFLVTTVIAYILYWAPYLRQLKDDIWSTKCLLIFIPAEEFSNIKSLAYFIKEFILEKKI